MPKITQQSIKQLKPKDKPYDVRDQDLKGFMIRVHPSGQMVYYVEVARGKRISLGRVNVLTLTAAKKKAMENLAQWANNIDPIQERRNFRKPKADTLGKFLDRHYQPWAEVNQRARTDTTRRIQTVFPTLLDKSLDSITPQAVEQCRIARAKAGISISTINRDVAALKSVMSKAVEWGQITVNPLAKFKLAKTDNQGVIRYLSPDERTRLLAALDARERRIWKKRESGNAWRKARGMPENQNPSGYADHLKPMVLVSLHTGVRQGELFTLTWDNVNLADTPTITIRGENAKSKNTRHVPLNATVLEALTLWRKQQGDPVTGPVFANRQGKAFDNVRKSWEVVLQQAEIVKFRWHDMRHDFASQLVMAGVDLNTVRELMGHSDIKMTLRYAHLAPGHKATAVEKLATGNPPTPNPTTQNNAKD